MDDTEGRALPPLTLLPSTAYTPFDHCFPACIAALPIPSCRPAADRSPCRLLPADHKCLHCLPHGSPHPAAMSEAARLRRPWPLAGGGEAGGHARQLRGGLQGARSDHHADVIRARRLPDMLFVPVPMTLLLPLHLVPPCAVCSPPLRAWLGAPATWLHLRRPRSFLRSSCP